MKTLWQGPQRSDHSGVETHVPEVLCFQILVAMKNNGETLSHVKTKRKALQLAFHHPAIGCNVILGLGGFNNAWVTAFNAQADFCIQVFN